MSRALFRSAPEARSITLAYRDIRAAPKQLRKEIAELKRANKILKAASVFLVHEIDRPRTRPSEQPIAVIEEFHATSGGTYSGDPGEIEAHYRH
ncbi:hypothetical protein ACFU6I_11720 [Streptomyces sp. NPDC057486]|uniref:hypothetical protein n=1 Tax=Streptomyces sp. NPDC057486 TaxID=3346145 RepID=UPI0036A5A9DD